MAKEISKDEQEQKEQIAKLNAELVQLRNKGKFTGFNTKIRYVTNDLRKNKTMNEEQKRRQLYKLCSEMATEINATFKK